VRGRPADFDRLHAPICFNGPLPIPTACVGLRTLLCLPGDTFQYAQSFSTSAGCVCVGGGVPVRHFPSITCAKAAGHNVTLTHLTGCDNGDASRLRCRVERGSRRHQRRWTSDFNLEQPGYRKDLSGQLFSVCGFVPCECTVEDFSNGVASVSSPFKLQCDRMGIIGLLMNWIAFSGVLQHLFH
jgi:hypothetical protein